MWGGAARKYGIILKNANRINTTVQSDDVETGGQLSVNVV